MNVMGARWRGLLVLAGLATLLTYVASPAHAYNVTYDAGLMRSYLKFDPGFDSIATNAVSNRRWSWQSNNPAGIDDSVYFKTLTPRFDTSFFQFDISQTGMYINITNDSPTRNYIAVVAGDTFKFGMYKRSSSTNNNATGIVVYWYDSAFTRIRVDTSAIVTVPAGGVWIESHLILVAPEYARHAMFQTVTTTSNGSGQTLDVDGVYVQPLGTASNAFWPIEPRLTANGDTNHLLVNHMPAGFARRTRTGYDPGTRFAVATQDSAAHYGGGATITSYDTYWTLAAGGANATLQGSLNVDSFVTMVSPSTPDGVVGLMRTSHYPVYIRATEQVADGLAGFSNVSINITLNLQKSPEEKVFLRYSTDSWATSTFRRASGTGNETTYTVTIPSVSSFTTYNYYAFTTTADTANGSLTHARAHYVTLSAGDSPLRFTTGAGVGPTINSWHTVQNPAPETGFDADLYMRSVNRTTGDTMWPRSRSTDNPVTFWVGMTPATDTPLARLVYCTSSGQWHAGIAASETRTVGDSIYFRFVLNQADNASFDYTDTVAYYFTLIAPAADSTYVHGNNTVDDISFSDSTKVEATARANPFIYRIRELRPTIDITVPSNNHDTGTASFQIRGTAVGDAQPGDTVVIFRNGVPQDTVFLNASLGFVGWCTIAAKSDSLSVKLTSDSTQTIAWDTHRISLYGTPTITIGINPVNGVETNQAYFQMSGTVTNGRPGDSVTIFVNGQPTDTVQVTATATWNGQVSLLGGATSTVGARLVNFLGNIAWDTPRIVNYDIHRMGGMSWVGILKGDWSKYADTIYNDGTAKYTEVVDDPDSFSGYMYYNKTIDWMWFRIVLDSKDTIAWQHSTDDIRVFGWMLWIDVNMDGYADWQLGLTPFNNGNGLNVMANSNTDQDFSDKTDFQTYAQTESYKSNGSDSIFIQQVPFSDVSGDSDIYLAFGAPLSAFQSPLVAPNKRIYETTPFRILYGTGSSPNAIGRDLSGATQGNEASAFSGAQIVTTANFADGAGDRPGGIVYDTRDALFPTENGTWTVGETIYFSGATWPTGPGRDSITVRIVLTGLDTNTQYSKQGTISYDTVGGFVGRGFWRPTGSGVAAGVYQVWVKHPIAGDTFYLYDQFRLDQVATSIAAWTQAPTQVMAGESILAVLRDTDKNINVATLQAVTALFTNVRTGETELVTLTETGVNEGYFSCTISITGASTDSIAGTGRMFGRAGDTITILYTDASDTVDTALYASVLVAPALTPAAFEFTDAFASGGILLLSEGDTFGIRLIDRGLNRDALHIESYTVRVTNAATAEFEDVILVEVSASADTFFAILATETDVAVLGSNSGKIFGSLTQDLWATFTDPYDGTDVRTDTLTMLGNGKSALRMTDATSTTIDTIPIGGFVYIEVIDRNRNGNPSVKDVIAIALTTSTGDSQTLQILESADNSGIFRSIGLFVTDSGPVTIGDSIIHAPHGAVLACSYVDAFPVGDSTYDTAVAGKSAAAGALIDSTGTAITSQTSADSIRVRVLDLDENKNWATSDTVRVLITNARTGETEYATLIETSVTNGGYETASFRHSQLVADSRSLDSVVMLLHGDTFTLTYVDANDPTDTFLLGAYTFYPAGVLATGTFPPNIRQGDSLVPVIADTDQNLRWDVVETIAVTITNQRTGETEVIILLESGPNSGIFNTTSIRVTRDTTSQVDDDTLFALAGDNITVTYTDPTDPTDVLVSGPFAVYIDSVASSCTGPTTVTIGKFFEPIVTDTDQDLNGTIVNTLLVRVYNSRTGESELFTLNETLENSGEFDGLAITVTSSAADSLVNGKIYAEGGDTLFFVYTDPTDALDACTSAGILVVRDTSPAYGTFPTSVKIGDSVLTTISDTDQNRSELVADTILVIYTNNRTGETEAVILYETNAYSGAFDSPLMRVSSNLADSADNDTLYALAGDTITIRYTDPYDTAQIVTSSPITVYWDTSTSNGTFPVTVRSGDSIVPVIRDTDQNLDGTRVETISITVTNGRTGETELVVLYETDSNSGIFDVTQIPVRESIGDSVDNDTLYALAGDTITVQYVDPTDPTDSLTGGPFSVVHDTTASAGTFPSFVRIADSIVPIVRDSDQNFSGLRVETVTILVTNSRTGETGLVILYETDSNSGIFDVTSIWTTPNIADSALNDTLYAQVGDTFTLLYTDPTHASDTLAGGPIPVYPTFAACTAVFPTTVTLGESLVPTITDTDRNLSAFVVDTIAVMVTNHRTGETEVVILFESGTNSSLFDSTVIFVTANLADSADNDTIYALAGDTLTIFYVDASNPNDTCLSAAITVTTSSSNGILSADSRVTLGDSFWVTVLDTNVNQNGAVQETLSVVVTNPATGETEVLVLYESGTASPLFDSVALATSGNIADSVSGDTRMYVRAGDTLVVYYVDPYNAADTRLSETTVIRPVPTTADSRVTSTQLYQGDTLSGVYILDGNRNLDIDLVDTLLVIVRNATTGETETITLHETGVNSGVFDSALVGTSSDSADSLSGTGRLYIRSGDSIVVDYADPWAAADTLVTIAITARAATTSTVAMDSRFILGDSVFITVHDGDANRDPALQESVTVTVTNPVTGETESVTLWEIGVNSGSFDTAGLGTTSNPADSASVSGTLYVRPGDTLALFYQDRYFATDSSRLDTGYARPRPATSSITSDTLVYLGDTLMSVFLTDTSANLDVDIHDSVTVTVINHRTGETEIATLHELGINGNIFDSAVVATSTDSTDSISGNGRLYGIPGDTIQVLYTDPYNAADTCATTLITLYPPFSRSLLTVGPTVTVGESFYVVLRDTDVNFNAALQETVSVTVTNPATGESATVILWEQGVNSGIFDSIPVWVTGNIADSISGNDTFYARSGDTFLITYLHAGTTDSSRVDTLVVVPVRTAADSRVTILQVFQGETISGVFIFDADRNQDIDLIDTLAVIVRNIQTGETEVVTLFETGVNSGVFDSSLVLTTKVIGDSLTVGLLYIGAGDSVVIDYADSRSPIDTLVTIPILARGATVSTVAMDSQFRIGDSIFITVTDGDANRDVLLQESVTVIVTNPASGETESIVLWEIGINSGIFDTAGLGTTANIADSLSLTSTLYARPGDTLSLYYQDRLIASDSARLDTPVARPQNSTSSSSFNPDTVVRGDSVRGVFITDPDRNLDADLVDSVQVVVTNSRTGETETVFLYETGPNSGVFDSPVIGTTSNILDSVAQNGTLYVRYGDTLLVSYTDTHTTTDTKLIGPITVVPALTASVITSDTRFYVGDSYLIVVTDGDANRDELAFDTVRVMITNPATGETEAVILTESGGANTGIFDVVKLGTTGNPADSASATGTMYVRNGDTLSIVYVDRYNTGDSARVDTGHAVPPATTAESWVNITQLFQGETLGQIFIRDLNRNLDIDLIDSIAVTARNATTGETEVVFLYETGVNSGVFDSDVILTSGNLLDSLSGTGKLYIRAGDSLVVDYLDSTTGGDSLTTNGILGRAATNSTIAMDSQFRIGDSLFITVVDGDNNRSLLLQESVTVVVTNPATGETESIVLWEIGVNSSTFDTAGLGTTSSPADSGSASGTLYVRPGDTLSLFYQDRYVGTDSSRLDTGYALPAQTTATSRVDTLTFNLGDSLAGLFLFDANRNLDVDFRDSLTVIVRNVQTGETETVQLTETGVTFAGFDSVSLAVSKNPSDSGAGSGRLYARNGDSIVMDYADPFAAADSLVSAAILVIEPLTNSATNADSRVRIGDSYFITVRDSDQNRDILVQESVTVTITNPATGETETVTLWEIGVNSGYFDTAGLGTTDNPADSGSTTGTLYLRSGDTLAVLYQDRYTASDSSRVDTGYAYRGASAADSWVNILQLFQGETLTSVFIRDANRNLDVDLIDSIIVIVRNAISGETELVTLYETGVNSGVFDSSLLLVTASAADSLSGSGRLTASAGDSLVVDYIDSTFAPADTLVTIRILVRGATASSITMDTSFRIGDSTFITVTDGDANRDVLLQESVTVTVTNPATGETTVVTLWEVGVNAGIFDTAPLFTSSNPADSLVSTESIYIRPGDTLIATYQDRSITTDSSRVDTAFGRPAPTASSSSYSPDTIRVGDTLTGVFVRDADRNLDADRIDTVQVVVTNSRTGETETVTLYETGVSSGVFDSALIGTSGGIADSLSQGGRLWVRAGDTIVILYTDTRVGVDTAQAGPITVLPILTSAILSTDSRVVIGDSFHIIVTDTDGNRDALAFETVSVVISNLATGETESLVLVESGTASSGIFDITRLGTTGNPADSTSGNGTMFLRAGDTLSVFYQDRFHATDSARVDTGYAVPMDSNSGSFLTETSVRIGDSIIGLYVRDYSRDLDVNITDSITVVIVNARTGETETVILRETTVNSGTFDSLVLGSTANPADSASNSGTLFVRAGDTIFATYQDPATASDSLVSASLLVRPLFSAALLSTDSSFRIGDSLAIVVTDTDANRDILVLDTVTVIITNPATGETEAVTLTESGGANTGVFDVVKLGTTGNLSDSISANGTIYLRAGDTLSVFYQDRYNSADSRTVDTGVALPAVTTADSFMTDTRARIGDTLAGVFIRDRDQNLDVDRLDTITVIVRNEQTGETEPLTLTETGVNSGVFDSFVLYVSAASADSVSGSGRLYARAGDSIQVLYQDPRTSTDSLITDRIRAYFLGWSVVGEPLGTGKGLNLGFLRWADYDRDGDLDLGVMGQDNLTAATRFLLYRNDGENTFSAVAEPMGAGLGLRSGSFDWGDYDADGDLDLVAVGRDNGGNRRLVVFRHDGGGAFTLLAEPMGANAGLDAASTEWGDYDNDGDLDFVASGIDGSGNRRLLIYRNDSGSFSLNAEPLGAGKGLSGDATAGATTRWGDFDRDGDLDLLVAGRDNLTFQPRLLLYRNDRGAFTLAAEPMGAGLGVLDASLAWADFDTDGDLDFAVTGHDGANRRFLVYRNDGGASFSVETQPLGASSGLQYSAVSWGDFDNDGDVDLAVAGHDGSAPRFIIYRNESGRFAIQSEPLGAGTGLGNASLGFADYDRDGDLDLAALGDDGTQKRLLIVQNLETPRANLRAAAPGLVTANGTVFSETVTLAWSPVTTDTTPAAGLTYNLRIGTVPGGANILAADTIVADSTGPLLIGNVQNGDTALFYLRTAGTYYWAAQAVDGGQLRGLWSVEGTFIVVPTTTSTGTFPSAIRVGDSVSAVLRDTDANRVFGSTETLVVTVTNMRTGETEILVLTESGASSATFGGNDTLQATQALSDSLSGNGRLFALAGDTLIIRYSDPQDAWDSVVSNPIPVVIDTTAATGVFPAALKAGDSLSPTITDSDQNLSGTRIDTIQVTVTNRRTGETEILTLVETDSNSGVFNVTRLFLSRSPSDSIDNDTLFALAADTLTVLYVDPNDPSDSVTGGPIVLYEDTTPSSGTFPIAVRLGDSLVPIIRDTDQNLDGKRIDTVSVTVTNLRTGETEVVILHETDSNSGVFDVTVVPVSRTPSDTVDNDTIFAGPGDSIVIRYVDPNDPTDSFSSAEITAFLPATASQLGADSVARIGDSFFIVVRDTDANRDISVFDTVTVVVTNPATGETEAVILIESGGANTGLFNITALPMSGSPSDSTSGSGRLHVRVGDTIAVVYIDRFNPTDSARLDTSLIVPTPSNSGSTVTVLAITVGETITGIFVTDTDRNRDADIIDTVTVTVINERSGETITITLLETGPNTGVFDSGTVRTTDNPADSGPGSGQPLYLRPGDTISVRYVDPADPTDSSRVTSALIATPLPTISILRADGTTLIGDSFYVIVRDTDADRDFNVIDTVLVTVYNPVTGESESVILIESGGANTGVFNVTPLPTSGNPIDSVTGSGRLYVRSGDTLVVFYQDRYNASDSSRLDTPLILPRPTNSGSTVTLPSIVIGETITGIFVTDTDRNRDVDLIDTISITLINERTGETITLVLTETGLSSGVFDSGAVTTSGNPADSGSGQPLYLRPGDTLSVRYIDPGDPTDSSRAVAAITVSPVATASSMTADGLTRIGDSFYVVLRDTDANRDIAVLDTVTVLITNPATGETEAVVLTESGGPNTGIFNVTALPTSGSPADSSTASGRLYVRAGDTLSVTYTDRFTPTDSSRLDTPLIVPTPSNSGSTVTVPAIVIGETITGIFVTDTDRNRDVDIVDSITITLVNERTGETITLTLLETGPNTGVFDSTTVTTSGNPADSGSGQPLYLRPGDTLTVRYTDPGDPTDSSRVTAGITASLSASSSSGIFVTSLSVGDSTRPVVTDTDANRDFARVDTITVTVTNGRTGETSTYVLYETDSNSGVFDVTPIRTSGRASDATFATETLYVRPGDTLVVAYQDATTPTDSTRSGGILVWPDTTGAGGTVSGSVRIGDSITPVIRDTDQNLDVLRIDTIAVIIRNERTGETELVILYETDSNSGVFDVTSLPISRIPGDSVDNDTLYALPADSFTVRYTDPNDPFDSFVLSGGSFIPAPSLATAVYPASVRIGDTVYAIVTDTDRNANGTRTETLAVTILNPRTGEQETLVLTETDSNSGVFNIAGLTVSGSAADSLSHSGLMFAIAADTLVVRYLDPSTPADSLASAGIPVLAPSATSSIDSPPRLVIGDSLPIVVRDSDQNTNGGRIDTIAIVITNNRTGETEILILYETDSNSGIFDVTKLKTSSDPRDSGSNSDTMAFLPGDTVTIRYQDPLTPSDSKAITLTAFPASASSALSCTASLRQGETLYPTVTDADQNLNAFLAETITVVVTNPATGETETIILTETAVNSGIFDIAGLPVSKAPADSLSGSGRLFGRIGDTLSVVYTDPDDLADRKTAVVRVVSTFTGLIQQINVFRTKTGSDTYRFTFVPTGINGETLPGLDGEPFTAEIIDSRGGTGRFTEFRTYLVRDSTNYVYTRAEDAQLWLRVTLVGETYYPNVIITGSGVTPLVIVGRRDTTVSEGVMVIPAGMFDTSGYDLIVEPYFDYATESRVQGQKTDAANDAMRAQGGRTVLPLEVRPEHQFYIRNRATGEYVRQYDTNLTITITYPDLDNNDLVDNTNVEEQTLQMYYLDEDLNRWILVPGTAQDKERNMVTATVNHLTIFTLIGVSANTTAGSVRVYPNPWRPNNGILDDGIEYVAGILNSGILIENVPAGSRLRIVTILGERILDRVFATGGTYQWDVRNEMNRPVASGVYYVIVEAPNGTRLVDKVAVIR